MRLARVALIAASLLAPAGAVAQTNPASAAGGEGAAPAQQPLSVALDIAMPDYAGERVEGTMALVGAMAVSPEMSATGKVLSYGGVGPSRQGAPGEEQYPAFIVPLIEGVDASLTPENVRRDAITLRLMLIQAHPRGKELLDAAAKRVVAAVVEQPPLPQQEVAKRTKDLDQQITALEDKMNLLQAMARNNATIGPEILKERIKSAELEKQRLEMDLAAQRVRRDVITQQMKEIQKEAAQLQAEDLMLEQLRRVEALRREQWEKTARMQKSGQVSAKDVVDAEEQWMASRIQIAGREEAVRQKAKSDLLDRLNAELATQMINEAEMEVRLAMIRQQQPSIDLAALDEQKLTHLAEQYRNLFRDPGALPPLYHELDKKLQELKRQRLALRVTDVKVVEGHKLPPPPPPGPGPY